MVKKKVQSSSSTTSTIHFFSTNFSNTSNSRINNIIKGNSSKYFICRLCNKSFKYIWLLTRHIIQVENKMKSQCQFYKKSVPRINEHQKYCKFKPINLGEFDSAINNENKFPEN